MNVVIICSDTFRYDHLGFLGKQPVQTPNLDKLAAESAVFSNFWLCSFPTLTHRIEVFTGRYTFPLYNWGALPHEFPVLSEVFKRHGFTTALIADDLHLFEEHFGFERGFDFVRNVPGQMHDPFQPASAPMVDLLCPAEKLEPPPHRLNRYRRNAYWYHQQSTNTTAVVFQEAMQWLERAPAKFFLWIDAFDPHEPWDAPQQFLQPYPWDPQADAVFWPRSGDASEYSEAELANMRSLYRAEVTQIDHWVGQLLEQMRNTRQLDSTAVIFTSDHGYYFGEHGLLGKPLRYRKPCKIYEELGHLPLLLRHPEGHGARQTIQGLAQPPDLYATTLDLAGIPPVPWAQGNSLMPRLRGQPGAQHFAVGGCYPHKGRVGCISFWTEEWAFIHSPTEGLADSELYHVPTDSSQTRNVISENRAVAQQLFDRLSSWLAGLGVPPARRRQLLNNAPFTPLDKLQYSLWLSKNRFSYWKNYRHYAQGG